MFQINISEFLGLDFTAQRLVKVTLQTETAAETKTVSEGAPLIYSKQPKRTDPINIAPSVPLNDDPTKRTRVLSMW